ncbi:hypothetical protein GCM10010400_17510 [Streptomyces aculeolatus]|uniref:DUF6339 family protein n=1 Tax=Streptomyces aculeolatus TaxID=270689 RepID=UPI001CED2D74|nr:DUF6339 family protein [Streptomyces aculeolatus]
MSVLYPRLLPAETDRLFRMLHKVPPGAHENVAATHSQRAVFAASGGQRVSRGDLERLRRSILSVAAEHNFPNTPNIAQRNEFDRRTARVLYEQSRMAPGEAAQRQVWAFLSLVLLPDVSVWRWPARSDGRYVADRFKGTDLTRHVFARLWTRAHVLRDPEQEDPYELLPVLGEADLDHIMARRVGLAGSPALVRALVRAHRDDSVAEDGQTSREMLRQMLARVLRLTAFVDVDAASEAELVQLVRGVRADVRRALSS